MILQLAAGVTLDSVDLLTTLSVSYAKITNIQTEGSVRIAHQDGFRLLGLPNVVIASEDVLLAQVAIAILA